VGGGGVVGGGSRLGRQPGGNLQLGPVAQRFHQGLREGITVSVRHRHRRRPGSLLALAAAALVMAGCSYDGEGGTATDDTAALATAG